MFAHKKQGGGVVPLGGGCTVSARVFWSAGRLRGEECHVARKHMDEAGRYHVGLEQGARLLGERQHGVNGEQVVCIPIIYCCLVFVIVLLFTRNTCYVSQVLRWGGGEEGVLEAHAKHDNVQTSVAVFINESSLHCLKTNYVHCAPFCAHASCMLRHTPMLIRS
jgi:hypothetical protein